MRKTPAFSWSKCIQRKLNYYIICQQGVNHLIFNAKYPHLQPDVECKLLKFKLILFSLFLLSFTFTFHSFSSFLRWNSGKHFQTCPENRVRWCHQHPCELCGGGVHDSRRESQLNLQRGQLLAYANHAVIGRLLSVFMSSWVNEPTVPSKMFGAKTHYVLNCLLQWEQ